MFTAALFSGTAAPLHHAPRRITSAPAENIPAPPRDFRGRNPAGRVKFPLFLPCPGGIPAVSALPTVKISAVPPLPTVKNYRCVDRGQGSGTANRGSEKAVGRAAERADHYCTPDHFLQYTFLPRITSSKNLPKIPLENPKNICVASGALPRAQL